MILIAKLGRLMSPDLPQLIEPLRLSRTGEEISGRYKIHDLHRAGELLHDKSGYVSFRLKFVRDREENLDCIIGEIRAELHAVCQRCLDSMVLQLVHPVYLGIVGNNTEISQLPGKCEPLILDDEHISLQELIEDELILAMPISPMHRQEQCRRKIEPVDRQNATTHKPFAILKKLTQKAGN